ncbi:uncharacterized protein LACBIDRAFT_308487 [Laccaria bicolor S238N-H82]|uniref:Predicted protein n=1 Tax=Laccaria bicolor (strain S238N-H82 / ATCC MYA-4686) TaxID=486041 RepID=B0CWF6_LACBS|nr:uncharacterized protein LACBIDRAFT_308487 [Laccaria bicolor S238N-H82]EDR13058.1 predicted protein [Laccaria bicolor S238N-H82]|eukprot:XP_001875556.1 predicted protein [Laccaria bicolor S238N-H82]
MPTWNGDNGPAAPPLPSTISPYHYLLSSSLPLPSTLSPLSPSPLPCSLPPPFFSSLPVESSGVHVDYVGDAIQWITLWMTQRTPMLSRNRKHQNNHGHL